MIELAPRHKIGLPVENPVLIAGGMIGYGEATHRGLDLSNVGAVVVGPISRSSRLGSEGPRLAETTGGFVLETGLQNRGVNAVMKKFARIWQRLGCPVIAQIVDDHPEDAAVTARRLLGADGLMGLELALSAQTTPAQMAEIVAAIRWENDLPLWVKSPLALATEIAAAAVKAEVDALVIGTPSSGALLNRDGVPVRGALYGPLSFAPMLAALIEVARLNLPIPLIGCGGIHTAAQARQAISAGASAVQLDSVIWIEPGSATRIAGEMIRE
jgi:dihydroorotate dehydrogenase (NAD+) catalytic subunit